MGNERILVAVDMMRSGRIFGMNEKGLLPSSGGFGRIWELKFQINAVDDNNMHK